MANVRVISLRDVEATVLPGGWSRMLISRDHVADNECSLGLSLFKAGTVSTSLRHEVEEVIYVVQGTGEVRLDDGAIAFGPGDAVVVPRDTWHCVANTGSGDVEMVFGFPSSAYPPTERRET